jgi:F-type H+-transporting ATPase subunit delta
MADNLSIARPYAKAIFNVAKERKQVSEWAQLLQVLAEIAKDSEVNELLKNPKISFEQLNALFVAMAAEFSSELKAQENQELKNFIALLSLDKRLMLLPEIAGLYHQLLTQQEDLVEVEVLYAQPLDEATKQQLHQQLEARFHCKVQVSYIHDSTLIGGAMIKTGDWVMDGSVKGKLAKLQESLQA